MLYWNLFSLFLLRLLFRRLLNEIIKFFPSFIRTEDVEGEQLKLKYQHALHIVPYSLDHSLSRLRVSL